MHNTQCTQKKSTPRDTAAKLKDTKSQEKKSGQGEKTQHNKEMTIRLTAHFPTAKLDAHRQ